MKVKELIEKLQSMPQDANVVSLNDGVLELNKHSWLSININELVILKKDEKGFYIEYAFKEGAPHDNRCLDWYSSFQPNAYIRNGWFGLDTCSEEEKKKILDDLLNDRLEKVGKIYRLSAFSCSWEENPEEKMKECKKSWEEYHSDKPFIPEDHVCKVGCPAKTCFEHTCPNWTYEEPVKCACWHLTDEVTIDDLFK